MGPLSPAATGPPAAGPGRGGGPAAPVVRGDGLTYRYPSGRRGVEAVDLEARPGEVVALLGPNGSGKSTLLRLLATELRPGAGRLELLGRVPSRRTVALRRRLGVAPDVPVHLDVLSGRHNVVLFGRAAGLGSREARERADALLERLGLAEDAAAPAGAYSHGMRRKLLLAQALVHEPDLLLLDEPTLGLDPPSREALLDLLRERAGTGAATVVASNDLPFVWELAHRVAFLHRGRKVAGGTPAELLEMTGEENLARAFLRLVGDGAGEGPGASEPAPPSGSEEDRP